VIALVDYGAGNLASVRKALSALGAEFETPRMPADLIHARGIIVPGVGHFDATRALDASWREALQTALGRGAALFGICLGMQWLFEGSAEAPQVPGLGLLQGTCVRLANPGPSTANPEGLTRPPSPKIPHVGWNSLTQPRPGVLMRGVADGAQVYFTHSYVAPLVPETAATTTYGLAFTAAVERGNIAGVQFHPEKSGDVGLQILRNWLDSCR
jgi:glutamine amidotransferase